MTELGFPITALLVAILSALLYRGARTDPAGAARARAYLILAVLGIVVAAAGAFVIALR